MVSTLSIEIKKKLTNEKQSMKGLLNIFDLTSHNSVKSSSGSTNLYKTLNSTTLE